MCVGVSSRCRRKQQPRNRQHTCQLWLLATVVGISVEFLCSTASAQSFATAHEIVPLSAGWLKLFHGDVQQHKQQFVLRPKNSLVTVVFYFFIYLFILKRIQWQCQQINNYSKQCFIHSLFYNWFEWRMSLNLHCTESVWNVRSCPLQWLMANNDNVLCCFDRAEILWYFFQADNKKLFSLSLSLYMKETVYRCW